MTNDEKLDNLSTQTRFFYYLINILKDSCYENEYLPQAYILEIAEKISSQLIGKISDFNFEWNEDYRKEIL